MEEIFSLAKRRGFVFPSSEIYGGIAGVYDLGPLGVELAHNIKKSWWVEIVEKRNNIVGLDSAILMNREVWEASGHVRSFTDQLVECKHCHLRYREDLLPNNKKCPNCGKRDWTSKRVFNLMFRTHIGPVEDSASEIFLRPETAQGIFVNFNNVVDTMRVKLPFGIAQIGKGFRNEITVGNFLFRVREFEMMELEYFTYPERANEDFKFWQQERMKWYLSLGLNPEKIRFRRHSQDEKAHYALESGDIEYNWPFMGWGELEGIANRGEYDLKAHSLASGKELSYYDESRKAKITPFVIEPSVGVGRIMLALLIDGYWKNNDRIVLKLHPKLSPVKIAVFPLLANKPDLVKKAESVYQELKFKNLGLVAWDDRGNIGKRYYYQDEIGTPFCVTVDFQSLEDDTVTIRERDTANQERVKINQLGEFFRKVFD